MATVFIHADHVTRNNLLSIHLMNQFCFSSNGLVQEFCEIGGVFSVSCAIVLDYRFLYSPLGIVLAPASVSEGFTHIGSIIHNGRLIYLAFILF